jgi:hypothetical protein
MGAGWGGAKGTWVGIVVDAQSGAGSRRAESHVFTMLLYIVDLLNLAKAVVVLMASNSNSETSSAGGESGQTCVH